jgi:hypothetical protein
MDYRSGKCSQCGAEYKIPASFAHNQARCRKCNGVVHLGAAPGRASEAPRRAAGKGEEERTAARAPEPQAAPRPAPAPATEPAPKPAPAAAPTPAPAPSPRAAAAARTPEAPTGVPAPRGGAEPAGAKKRSVAGILVAVALVLAAIVLFLMRDTLFGDDAAPAVGTAPENPAPERAASY